MKRLGKTRQQERRKYFRLKAYHLVKFKLVSQPQADWSVGYLKDISGGGANLFSEAELKKGDVIQLYINFPHLEVPILSIAKTVRVVKAGAKEIKYQSGLEFVEIDNLSREFIDKSINRVKTIVDEKKS